MIRVTGTSREDKSTFAMVSRWILLRMWNFLDKFVEKIKTYILCSVTYFCPKIVPFYQIMRKIFYSQTGRTCRSNNAYVFFIWRNSPRWARASSFTRFLDHTQRRTTAGRTPLVEWLACRRDLYLTTHNTHNRQTPMPPSGIRTQIFSRRAAADIRLRPRGHWDRQWCIWRRNCLAVTKAKYRHIYNVI